MSELRTLFDLIGVLARKRYQTADRLFPPWGLNHTEARLLTLLNAEANAVSQDVLSQKVYVDRSNVGRALDRLARENYLVKRKDPSDKRANLVLITDKGRTTAQEIRRLGDEMATTFFGDLTEDEAGQIVRMLRQSETKGDPIHDENL
mgnify:CR=1 FL=1